MNGSALVRRGSGLLLRSGSAAIGLGAIIAVWVTFCVTLNYIRETALINARNETANLARAFEEQITRSVKAVDQSLMFVRESWARNPDGFDVASWARNASAVADFAIQLTIVRPDGWTREFKTQPDVKPVDLTDREHIRFQLDSPGDELFISKPVIGRVSRRWSIQFTRKLFDRNGQFDGVAVVSVDPSYLTRFYGSIDLGSNGAVTLFGTDGVVRALARGTSAGDASADLGKVVRIEPDHQPISAKGRATAVDFDGVRRVTSFRAVRAYPLVVSVGVGEADILAEYKTLRRTDGIGAIALTVLLLAATAGTLRHQHRHEVARVKLRESERLYAEKSSLLETALEHMNQGIIMIDGESRLQVCNRRASAMLGLPPHMVESGRRFEDLIRYQWAMGEFSLPDGDLTSEQEVLLRFGYVAGVAKVYERRRPSGEMLEIRSMPLQDGGVVRTFTDISVRKAFEEDLRQAHDQAHSAARAKSEFLAVMSHEIRSPLSGLVGALDLLRTTELLPDQAHMAELAQGSAHNLLAILNDILDFSKIEAGAITLSLEPVDLRSLMAELTEPHALVAQAKDVVLRSEIGATVPSLIRTDRLRLGQIVTNLLSNAVKFTSRGSVMLSVALETSDGVDTLRVAVRDTGYGMDGQTLGRLFQPFTQADGSSSRVAGGTGLGLCISRRLAEVLEGSLTVVSEPGVGSCFTLLMRCVAERNAVAPISPASDLSLDDALSGVRVLVVDDNPTNRWLTERQLVTLGAAVEAVANGHAALDLLERLEFNVIVTDCHMPGLDGVALAATIRESANPHRDRPIVGLTADVTREQARRCTESGMNDLLYKPVARARLAQSINELVRKGVAGGEGASGSGPAARWGAGPVPSSLVFDDTMLRDLFDPDDPAATTWLRTFCDNALRQVSALEGLASAKSLDRTALAAAAHVLVGASLSVGAMRLADTVRTLERAMLNTSQSEIVAQIADIEAERRAVVLAIDATLCELAPT